MYQSPTEVMTPPTNVDRVPAIEVDTHFSSGSVCAVLRSLPVQLDAI